LTLINRFRKASKTMKINEKHECNTNAMLFMQQRMCRNEMLLF
jgi:hypothetical protein